MLGSELSPIDTATVATALGPVASSGLGPTLMHEHIDILPALRAAGVTEDQIEQMLVRNPRAIFEASVTA
jgi:predicted metal-dependent phosphotriesterase family hydrolase